MKKNCITIFVALVVSLTVLPAVWAGGGSAGGTSGGSGSPQALPTITMYPNAGNVSSGVVGGYKGDVFASQGFKLDVWAFSNEKTNAILASGDLPDIMYIQNENLTDVIEGGMLLELEPYLDQLPRLKAYKDAAVALNYVRRFKSAGTGKLYGLPTTVGDHSTKYAVVDSTERNNVKIRWDVYQKIGAPPIRSYDELIDVMEKMYKASPVDEKGNKFYGTILNNGSDSNFWACIYLWERWQGYLEWNLPYMLDTNMITGEISSILNTSSNYYKGLKWYNEVNRRGLMDPDSINNDRPTQKAKVDAGYALVPSGYLPGWFAQNDMPYYIPGTQIYYNTTSAYGGLLFGINAKVKNDPVKLKACLAYLDLMYDPDAQFMIRCGPDGDFWYSDGKGNAFFTEAGLAYMKARGNFDGYTLKSGEQIALWGIPFGANLGAQLSYKDGAGGPRIITVTEWKEAQAFALADDSIAQWQKTTGYKDWKEWLGPNFHGTGPLDNVASFCTPQPDQDLQLIVSALRDTVVNASWQMVYAKSEAEFQQIWNKMVGDCNGLGARKVIDWRLADIKKAIAVRDSLEN
jgi:hypothetical protein